MGLSSNIAANPGARGWGFWTGLALAACLWAVGCEPIEIDKPGTGGVDSAGTATLVVTNSISNNPGMILLGIYRPEAPSAAQNPPPVKILGPVPESATVIFKVPAGVWKLAYRDTDSLSLRPMTDENGEELIWPKAIFKKDTIYAAQIFTEDKRNIWIYNIPIKP